MFFPYGERPFFDLIQNRRYHKLQCSAHHTLLFLKDGIVEPKEKVVVRHRLSKHDPAATNTHTTIGERLDAR
jgi:hypothetical protein